MGDVEGQWSVLVNWRTESHEATRKSKSYAVVDGIETLDEVTEAQPETVVEEGPEVSVLPTQDLAVWPEVVDHIQDADGVAIRLRWSPEKVKIEVEKDFLDAKAAKNLEPSQDKWPGQDMSHQAGVKVTKKMKYVLLYRVWTKMDLGEGRVPVEIWFGGPNTVLRIVKNPYWSAKVPVISEPITKIAGSFWGKSKVAPVEQLQYQINDVMNMGMDSAAYSIMPIILTDPLKNPRTESMILGKGAIWQTNPTDTQFAEMPALWKEALGMVSVLKSQIMESMEVNDAMMGKMPAGRKNAAMVAQMQAEAIASISDTVRRFESGLMNPLLEWFYELDMQYRDSELSVLLDGELGVEAQVEQIAPDEIHRKYFFRWNGTDQILGGQKIQQQIAMMNVLRGIPPEAMNGRKLDIGPILDAITEATFGPTVARQILIDLKQEVGIDPRLENRLLWNGNGLPVHPQDNDQEHVEIHEQGAQETGDPQGLIRAHIQAHVAQMQAKAKPQMPQGMPGVPGGAGPGVPGTPRPGAVPGPPKGPQGPAGMVHPDQMMDPQAGARG
ncbi:MAG: portal protein [Acidobacteriaceae bacterium]